MYLFTLNIPMMKNKKFSFFQFFYIIIIQIDIFVLKIQQLENTIMKNAAYFQLKYQVTASIIFSLFLLYYPKFFFIGPNNKKSKYARYVCRILQFFTYGFQSIQVLDFLAEYGITLVSNSFTFLERNWILLLNQILFL